MPKHLTIVTDHLSLTRGEFRETETLCRKAIDALLTDFVEDLSAAVSKFEVLKTEHYKALLTSLAESRAVQETKL